MKFSLTVRFTCFASFSNPVNFLQFTFAEGCQYKKLTKLSQIY